MNVSQTTIPIGGVLRCCLATVATEYVDRDEPVNEGSTSQCHHCSRSFTLRKRLNGKMVWWPDDFEFNPADY